MRQPTAGVAPLRGSSLRSSPLRCATPAVVSEPQDTGKDQAIALLNWDANGEF